MRSIVFVLSLALALVGCAESPPPIAEVTPIAVEVDGLPLGSFELTVTGDGDFELEGAGSVSYDPTQGYGIYLQRQNSYDGVTFVLPEDILPGSYALDNATEVRSMSQKIIRVGAMITRDPLPEDSMPLRVYGDTIRGVLTLTSVDPFTGAFAFGATDLGVTQIVRGQFHAIPRPPKASDE